MDEYVFKNHAEKEFWEKALIAAMTAGDLPLAALNAADSAVAFRRSRMAGLTRPGVKAA